MCILASFSGRLYVGVKGDLLSRLYQHRTAEPPSFTARYRITRLVYFEQTPNVRAAIERETEIKGWSREAKQIPRAFAARRFARNDTPYPRLVSRSRTPARSGVVVNTSLSGSCFSFFIRAAAFSIV
ncbi:MAG: GIY-YIG nuclease family protein [Gemmatimonadales bacterium]|nr:GIY-YIG nuclease family protein [Gemmatimonadales bacterium]